MTRILGFRVLVALASLGLTVAAAGQPGTDASGIPPELLAPNEEARRFFAAAEARPFAGELLDRVPMAVVDFARSYLTQLLMPGEQVPNWREALIDLEDIAAARPGGRQATMIDATNQFGPQRVYFTDRPIRALLPPGALLIARVGSPVDPASARIEVAHVSPKVVMVTRAIYRREGTLRCPESAHTEFYSDPASPATMMDFVTLVWAVHLERQTATLGLCFGAEEREPGVYVWRSFDSNGRRLPGLDAGQPPMRIVSVAGI